MTRHHHRRPLPRHGSQRLPHEGPVAGCDSGEGLVGEQTPWRTDSGESERHALALPAGQGAGPPVEHLAKAHGLDHPGHTIATAPPPYEGVEVLTNREMGSECRLLRGVHQPLFREAGQPGARPETTVVEHPTVLGPHPPHRDPEEGGLLSSCFSTPTRVPLNTSRTHKVPPPSPRPRRPWI